MVLAYSLKQMYDYLLLMKDSAINLDLPRFRALNKQFNPLYNRVFPPGPNIEGELNEYFDLTRNAFSYCFFQENQDIVDMNISRGDQLMRKIKRELVNLGLE
jgi:hypothetical protein